MATVTEDKLKLAGGYRYKNARKPELYKDIIGAEHKSQTKPVWMEKEEVVQEEKFRRVQDGLGEKDQNGLEKF